MLKGSFQVKMYFNLILYFKITLHGGHGGLRDKVA